MAKINRDFLDPALMSLNEFTKLRIERDKAEIRAHDAIANSIKNKSKSTLIVRQNLSRGAMIFIILLGVGVLAQMLVKSFSDYLRPIQLNEAPREGGSIPDLLIPNQSRNIASERCRDNYSFERVCSDEILLANGSKYTGQWRNGYAEGTGTLSFSDGGSFSGQWRNGSLIHVGEFSSPYIDSSISSKVTVFFSHSAEDINPFFSSVVTGHIFANVRDSIWSSAYCYLEIIFENQKLTVELSQGLSFDAEIVSFEYMHNPNFTKNEFDEAMSRCQYQYSGF